MTLQEFIKLIPTIILQRGQEYFDNGNILQLEDDQLGNWFAEVEGSFRVYEVVIESENNRITNYTCDCPYDEAICKHIAAVALRIESSKTSPISSVETVEADNWEDLINNASLNDLKQFMLDLGHQNKDFRHQVKLFFSEPTSAKGADNIPYYQNQMNGIFENYEYQGYIDYRNTHKATSDLNDFLIKADRFIANKNHNEAFCIAAASIMEAVKAIQNMDDSSGECSGAIDESFTIIEKAFHESPSQDLKVKIFEWLAEQVKIADYNNYGLGEHLESLFFETAVLTHQIDVAYRFIETQVNRLKQQDNWHDKYHLQQYIGQKIKLLQSEGRIKEADMIIDTYLHFAEFRQIRVDQFLAEHNSEKAEELILEGIHIAHQEKAPGTARQWKDQLLVLYKNQNHNKKFNALARELFIENTSEIKYYRYYKQSSSSAEWVKLRNVLITELKKPSVGFFRGISLKNLAQIYIEEQMIDELFEIVTASNNIHSIISYTDQLKEKYSFELLEYYKAGIEIEARHTGRNAYVSLVEYLKKMAELKGGKSAAKALKESLINQHKNRPAMKEEFKKLNFD